MLFVKHMVDGFYMTPGKTKFTLTPTHNSPFFHFHFCKNSSFF